VIFPGATVNAFDHRQLRLLRERGSHGQDEEEGKDDQFNIMRYCTGEVRGNLRTLAVDN
jgi:hypothetical protein